MWVSDLDGDAICAAWPRLRLVSMKSAICMEAVFSAKETSMWSGQMQSGRLLAMTARAGNVARTGSLPPIPDLRMRMSGPDPIPGLASTTDVAGGSSMRGKMTLTGLCRLSGEPRRCVGA